ncbi:uncharacterized protein LOC107037038 [Diachasma alloeum]|uniref:uncharacterized protein LOC107037038 n=1 Tax=Diachasma alloeum TaxID=454923 RepID=UPI0007384FD4|nr:uncharacterized protein LOC107037038 [Diachasma alloeum]
MLLMRNDLLDRISTYTCQKFVGIGDELILTSSGVLGDVLPRSRRQIAEARGLKYIRPGDLEDLLEGDEVRGHEHEILSFPGSDLNIPCNHEGKEITWVMSISRPNYTWTRVDSSPISGTIRKNGNLELYDVDAKDAGNYSCIVTYVDPDNEELVENIYQHSIQIVTLPRYSLRGGNRYKMDICEDPELDILSVYLPSKLNEVLCKNSICDAFIFAPHCHSHQVSIRVLVVPTNPSKLFPISSSQCGLRCRKAVQDKLAFLLTQNLRIILRKTSCRIVPRTGSYQLRIDLWILEVEEAEELMNGPKEGTGVMLMVKLDFLLGVLRDMVLITVIVFLAPLITTVKTYRRGARGVLWGPISLALVPGCANLARILL